MPRQEYSRRRQRRGFTVVEMLVSAMLLGTVIAVAVPTLRWVGHERRAAQRRLLAMTEVENTMELLTAQPWEALTQESVEQVELAAHVRTRLAEPEFQVALQEQADAKRIQIELRWKSVHGSLVAPVRLTAWTFRDGLTE